MVFSKILISGVTAAAIVGAGGVALATTGDSAGSGSPAAQHSTAKQAHGKQGHGKHGKHGGFRLLRHLDHATIVRDTKKRGDVTAQLIRGTVEAVSSSSITVVSADKTSETFAVTGKTKVHARADGKRTASSIGKVSTGDHVFAAAVGADKPVARRILDLGTK